MSYRMIIGRSTIQPMDDKTSSIIRYWWHRCTRKYAGTDRGHHLYRALLDRYSGNYEGCFNKMEEAQ